MRDALNLHLIRQYIEDERRRKKRNQTFFSVYIVAVIIITLILNQVLPFTNNSFVFTIGILLLILGFVVRNNADNIPTYYHGHKILAGTLPNDEVRRPLNRSVLTSIEYTIGATALVLMFIFWQTFTFSTAFSIFGAVLGLSFIGAVLSSAYRFWSNWKTLSDVEQEEVQKISIRAWSFWGLLCALVLIFTWLSLPVGFLILTALATLITLTPLGQAVVINWIVRLWIQRGVAKGHYQRGLEKTRSLKRIFGDHLNIKLYEGQLVYYAGMYEESLAFWQSLLPRMQNQWASQMASTLAFVSGSARRIGDYDTALKSIEAAIEIAPETSALYCQLADTYLDIGEEPERALQLTRFAMTLKIHPRAATSVWGIHARALAANGLFDEADTWIEKVRANTRKAVSSLAYSQYQTGRIEAYKGNLDAARDYFNQSIETDPEGDAAVVARHELEKLKKME